MEPLEQFCCKFYTDTLSQPAIHPPNFVQIDAVSKEIYAKMSSMITAIWHEAYKVFSLTH